METDQWHLFSRPDFDLRFKYPQVTTLGQGVTINESRAADFYRAHLLTQDSQKVYFEITRYRGISVQEEYLRHKAGWKEQVALQEVSSSELLLGELGTIPVGR